VCVCVCLCVCVCVCMCFCVCMCVCMFVCVWVLFCVGGCWTDNEGKLNIDAWCQFYFFEQFYQHFTCSFLWILFHYNLTTIPCTQNVPLDILSPQYLFSKFVPITLSHVCLYNSCNLVSLKPLTKMSFSSSTKLFLHTFVIIFIASWLVFLINLNI